MAYSPFSWAIHQLVQSFSFLLQSVWQTLDLPVSLQMTQWSVEFFTLVRYLLRQYTWNPFFFFFFFCSGKRNLGERWHTIYSSQSEPLSCCHTKGLPASQKAYVSQRCGGGTPECRSEEARERGWTWVWLWSEPAGPSITHWLQGLEQTFPFSKP